LDVSKKIFPPPLPVSTDQTSVTLVKQSPWRKQPQGVADKPATSLPWGDSTADRRSSPPSPAVKSAPSPALKTFGVGARATLPRAGGATDISPAASTAKEVSIGFAELDNDSSLKTLPAVSGVKKIPTVMACGGQKNLPPPPIRAKFNVAASNGHNGAANKNVPKTNFPAPPSWIKNNNTKEDMPVNKLSGNVSSASGSVMEEDDEAKEEDEDDDDYEKPIETPPKQPAVKPLTNLSNSFNQNAPRPPAKSPSQPGNPSVVKSPSTVSNAKENANVEVVHAATGKRYRRLPLPRLGAAKPPKKLAKPGNIELERFREPVAADDEEMYEDATSDSVSTGTQSMVGGGSQAKGVVPKGGSGKKVLDDDDDQEIYEELD